MANVKISKEEIYQQLRDEILLGVRQPGERLIEVSLAEHLGVSRTPVREVLARLEQDNLAVRSERGLVVHESNAEEILDLYDVRIALEARVAALAANRRTDVDLLRLERAHNRMGLLNGSSITDVARLNKEFHVAVWEAAHSAPFNDLLRRVDLHVSRYTASTLSHPGRLDQAHAEHAKLLECIRLRDSESAARCAVTHFTEARDIRLRQWLEGAEGSPAEFGGVNPSQA